MADPASRANKLLALAAKKNGGPLPERTSAALEAADVIAEHELIVVRPRAEKPKLGTDYDRVVEWAVIQIKRNGVRCARCNGAVFISCIAFLNRGAVVCDGCAAKAGIRVDERRDHD